MNRRGHKNTLTCVHTHTHTQSHPCLFGVCVCVCVCVSVCVCVCVTEYCSVVQSVECESSALSTGAWYAKYASVYIM